MNILFATRDEVLKEHTLKIFAEYGHSVAVVSSCKKALEYLLDFNFDLVVFDPDLDELDGLDTLQIIKKSRPKLPLIVTTGETSYETGLKIAKSGVFFRLGKPIDEDITRKLINSVLK